MLEKFFKLKENGTDVKTEVIGGVTTFMAMAYILAVNPSILSASGMDPQAILIATALASFIGTLCMALMANYPFALAPGLYTGPSVLPTFTGFNIGAIGETFGQCFTSAALTNFNGLDFFVVMCAFLFVDVFDTLGTLIGCADKAKMLDKNGKLPRIKQALLADSVATCAGAVLGTSTTTTFVESSSGVSEGARTGLASVVTSLLFLVSIVLSPIFIAIPGFATAPALIFVGFLMIMAVKDISFENPIESIPAYLALLSMPLLYSISDGIAVGIISYVILHVFTGKAKEVKPLMYILAILFILKYAFL